MHIGNSYAQVHTPKLLEVAIMKLSLKVGALIALILGSFLLLMIIGLTTLRIASSGDNQARVEQLFKSTFNIVVEIESYVKSGKMDEAQAKS